MIPYRRFVEFGLGRDPRKQVRLASPAFLATTVFYGFAVTYADRADHAHGFLFSHAYDHKALEQLSGSLVRSDSLYRQAVEESQVLTWRFGGFASGFAATTWLKPVDYRNGFPIAVRHAEFGEIGSLHANSYMADFGDEQLDAASVFAGYLSFVFGVRRAQERTRLTAREIDIVRLIAADGSNPEIAEDLHISRSTVATHVENILGKLGVRSRVGSRWKPRVCGWYKAQRLASTS